LDGVLLLDKPAGLTSQIAVIRAKLLLRAAKAGHTGTLDPMATGLLPLAFGEATKFSHVLLDANKSYTATLRLGLTTTTGDLEGEITSRARVEVDAEQIEAAIAQFRGEISQIPPMHSALKHKGKPLYQYARAGIDIERHPRRVQIHVLELIARESEELCVRVSCSKGTYVRVLAEDIGRTLGCGAALSALRRVVVGRFDIDDAVSLDELAAMSDRERIQQVLPVDALLGGLPEHALDPDQTLRITRGQEVVCSPDVQPGLVRIYGPRAQFLGVASSNEGYLRPRRLVSTGPVQA